jgi:O-antigen/teichoic acid export membrane protein
LNVFFGPLVNAARATAYHVQAAVANFASNFQMAINPQITKTYASGQLEETHKLIFKGVRITFCMLLMICLPLAIEAPTVLGLWLVEVPEGSVTFLRLLLAVLILQQSSNALVTAVAATGTIKRYDLILGTLMLTIVPISYVVLRLGGAPWSVFVVFLAVVVVAFFLNLYIILPMIQLRLKDYLRYGIGRCTLVLMLSLIAPLVMHLIKGPGLLFSLLNIVVIVICTGVMAYCFGMETEERHAVVKKVKGFVAKLKK